jgi:hypothetical protein
MAFSIALCSSLNRHQTIVFSLPNVLTRSAMYCGFGLLSHFAIRDNFERVVIPPSSVTNSCPVSARTFRSCSSESRTSSMLTRIGGMLWTLSFQP